MGKGHGKGSEFERQLCKKLSMWWSNGTRDDLYWRSSMSGGRATIRGRQHKSTAGHYGDITSTDTVGRELTQLFVLEAKRGYQECSVGDLLDAGPRNKPMIEEWFQQAIHERELAQVPGWLLITRRNNRETVVFMPWDMFQLLCSYGAKLNHSRPFLKFSNGEQFVFGTTLDNFLRVVSADIISAVVNLEGE